MKMLSCRDLGTECDFIASGETTEEVMQHISDHAYAAHRMKTEDLTPEMMKHAADMIRNG